MLASASRALLTRWKLDPTILLGAALFAGAYLAIVGPLRKRYGWGPEVKRGQVAAFLIGTTVMLLALISPLDDLGDA